MDAIIGAIWSFGFNFAPLGWMLCQGQLLSIAENQALYTLIGTTYGGDGQVTFALPDLRGRVIIGAGQGTGQPNYVVGQQAGNENITLTTANLPAHSHQVLSAKVPVNTAGGTTNDPTGGVFAGPQSSLGNVYQTTTNTQMAANNGTTTPTGNSLPLSILNPFLTINYCICVEGIFPSRN